MLQIERLHESEHSQMCCSLPAATATAQCNDFSILNTSEQKLTQEILLLTEAIETSLSGQGCDCIRET